MFRRVTGETVECSLKIKVPQINVQGSHSNMVLDLNGDIMVHEMIVAESRLCCVSIGVDLLQVVPIAHNHLLKLMLRVLLDAFDFYLLGLKIEQLLMFGSHHPTLLMMDRGRGVVVYQAIYFVGYNRLLFKTQSL